MKTERGKWLYNTPEFERVESVILTTNRQIPIILMQVQFAEIIKFRKASMATMLARGKEGTPTYYAIGPGQLALYPVPDGIYEVKVRHITSHEWSGEDFNLEEESPSFLAAAKRREGEL